MKNRVIDSRDDHENYDQRAVILFIGYCENRIITNTTETTNLV